MNKEANKVITITIGTPHNGDITPEYVNSLLGMAMQSAFSMPIRIKLHLNEGCYVHQGRNKIGAACYDDYLLFIDSDMAFPTDGLVKLINSGKDIIGGLYHSRKAPHLPLVYKKGKKGYVAIENKHDKIFECDAVATGFMLISKKVLEAFDKDIKKGGEFPFNFKNVDGIELGDDIAFCYRAKKLGFKIYCDPTIPLGHVGKEVITENNYLAYKMTE